MLITNNGVTPITMNLRDGTSYLLTPGVATTVPDAATTMIDDSAYLIGLFNAGTLSVTTNAGGAFAGFPTVVNASDSAAGKLLTVHAKVAQDGSRSLVDSTQSQLPVMAINPATGKPDAPTMAAIAAAGVGPQPGMLVFATAGDSRAIPFVDANNVVRSRGYWVNQTLQRLGHPAVWGYNGGVAGQRTDQFAGRIAAIASMSSITDVVLKGGANDHGQLYPSASTSGVTAAANLISYIDTLRKAGKRVWVEEDEGAETGWPGATYTWNAAIATQTGIQNDIVEKYCQGLSGVTFLRWSHAINDRTSATNKFLVGIKYDGLHDADGGATVKAVDFISRYPTAFGVGRAPVNPQTKTYSGDPANPVQILDNPGNVTRTGGTLGGGAATFSPWAMATATAAKSFVTSNGKIYYTALGGAATGTTAPSHTTGSVSDGGVVWTYIMSATNSIPQYWGVTVGGGGTYAVSTEVSADNGVEIVLIAFFSAANSKINLITGGDYNGAFRGRQVVGGKYYMRSTVQIDDQTNIGMVGLTWDRGDMGGNGPADGYANSSLWNDNQGRYTRLFSKYPLIETRFTDSFDCAAQSTASGNVIGTVASWNNALTSVIGAGAGFAILRLRDVQMLRAA